MHHRPGRSMGKSDALSRRADHGTGAGDNNNVTYSAQSSFAAHAVKSPLRTITGRRRARYPSGDPQGKREGRQEEQSEVRHGTPEVKGKSVRASEWSEHDGLLCFRDRIYVPNDPDYAVASHPSTMTPSSRTPRTLEDTGLVSRNYWWPQMSATLAICEECDPCLGLRFSDAVQLESSTRSQLRRTAGMSSVWISLWNFQTRMGTMQS